MPAKFKFVSVVTSRKRVIAYIPKATSRIGTCGFAEDLEDIASPIEDAQYFGLARELSVETFGRLQRFEPAEALFLFDGAPLGRLRLALTKVFFAANPGVQIDEAQGNSLGRHEQRWVKQKALVIDR